MLFTAATLATLATAVLAEAPPYTPLKVPAVPLAVRGPYTNVWSSTANDSSLDTNGAKYWTGREVGWTGAVQIDDKTYQWMGHKDSGLDRVAPANVDLDSQWSNFTYDCDGVELKAAFFSPVEPTDLCRTSVPLSYLQVSVNNKDDSDHKVRVYADVDGRWSAPRDNMTVEWGIKEGNVNTFETKLQDPLMFGEDLDTSLYGRMTFNTAKGNAQKLTYQAGSTKEVHKSLESGELSGDIDENFRPVNDNSPIVAYLHDLGKVAKGKESSVLYTVGTIQDPGVQFNTTEGMQQLDPWWKTCFDSEDDMISQHYKDFERAGQEGANWEQQLKSDISKFYGSDSDLKNPGKNEQDSYYAVTAMSARQIMCSYTLVQRPSTANHSSGDDNLPFAIQKETSSNGNVGTIDVIFPASPFWVYSNIEMMRYVNDAVMESQKLFQEDYTLHDIGTHYPNATGHYNRDDMENMPLEECGNFIVMASIYYELSKDIDYLKENYHWLTQFTKYLLEYSAEPGEQLSTDDFMGTLEKQSNLAMKGIVGIAAMSELAKVVGDNDNAKIWAENATSIYEHWRGKAIATGDDGKEYNMLSYEDENSWGMLYNAYPAHLLDLKIADGFIEDSREWAETLKSKADQWGIPLDSRQHWTKTDWHVWMSGYVKKDLRADFITNLARFLENDPLDAPFRDLYDTVTGEYANGIEFKARPVVGGHYALLANLKFGKDHTYHD